MAKKKIEFKPDPQTSGILSKLYITPSQRNTILKWFLLSLVCVFGLVIQDSVLGRARIFGGMIDLAPGAILMICVMQGSESGSLFALIASMIFVFSGSAPDTYVIAFLTILACLAALFRENFLRRGFSSAWVCAGVAMCVYELSVFAMGLFFGLTHGGRFGAFAMTAVLSALAMGALYPLLEWIGKIGGETWKE